MFYIPNKSNVLVVAGSDGTTEAQLRRCSEQPPKEGQFSSFLLLCGSSRGFAVWAYLGGGSRESFLPLKRLVMVDAGSVPTTSKYERRHDGGRR
ncbi:hypothetical protein LR48_Vigan04g140200 [Vigna angularis]|uniref:Uncharacterized protein n=1 Tax=Phaseolus angularis TaxID=3914 RepID=A0A0L9UF83_PHAAN|nr:hypothetical protein LR48_Vigan04g140200 [Vigna angularis]